MEEISEEKTKLILHCLYIILNEFFDTKQQLLWVHFLKKKAVVSKGQAKKVEKEFKKDEYEKGISKLIDYMEKRECLIKLERSLECEDFPAENNTKVLLTHIIFHKNEDLLLCLHHWHQLHQLRDTLKEFDSFEEDDEKFRKQLVFAALHEITENKEDKTILQAVHDMMPNFQVDSDTTKKHASLKRHAETSGIQTKPSASQNSPQTNIDDIERKNLKRSKEKDEANTDSKRSRSKGNGTSDEREQDNQRTKQKMQDIREKRNRKKQSKKDGLKPPDETEPNVEGRKENEEQKNPNREKKMNDAVETRSKKNQSKNNKSKLPDVSERNVKDGEEKKEKKNANTEKNLKHDDEKHVQNEKSEKSGNLPIKDIPEHNLDEDCINFFVSFEPGVSFVPNTLGMHIYLECFEEKSLYKMAYHERNDYYFITIPRMENCKKLLYKFCYVNVNNQPRWELLPSNIWNVNRSIDVSDKTRTILSYNVAIFSDYWYNGYNDMWKDRCCRGMGKFLPSGISEEHFNKLHAWIKCAMKGCTFHPEWFEDHWTNTKPSPGVFETLLYSWIKLFNDRCDKQKIIKHITAALAIVVLLRVEKHDIVTPKLFSEIFATLDTSELDENDMTELYMRVTKIFSNSRLIAEIFFTLFHYLLIWIKIPSNNIEYHTLS